MEAMWWNRPQGSVTGGQQTPPPEGQQQQQVPAQEDELARLVDRKIAERQQQYNEFAEQNKRKLNDLTQKFMEDPGRAKFGTMAFEHFSQLLRVNPGAPLEALYDLTVQQTANWQKAGVKPPESQGQQWPGIPGHSQQHNGTPILGDAKYRTDERGMQAPGYLSDEDRTAAAQTYIQARRQDLEYGKSKGEAGQTMKEFFTNIEKAQEISR